MEDELNSPYHAPQVPIVFHDDGSGRYSLTEYPRNVPPRLSSGFTVTQRRTKIRTVSIEIRAKKRKREMESNDDTKDGKVMDHQTTTEESNQNREEYEVVSNSPNKSIINPPFLKDYEGDFNEPFNSYIPSPRESYCRWQINLSSFDDIKAKPFPNEGQMKITFQSRKFEGEWNQTIKRHSSWSEQAFGKSNYLIPLHEADTGECHAIFTHIAVFVGEHKDGFSEENNHPHHPISQLSINEKQHHDENNENVEKHEEGEMVQKVFLIHMPIQEVLREQQRNQSKSPLSRKNKEAPTLDRSDSLEEKRRKLFDI